MTSPPDPALQLAASLRRTQVEALCERMAFDLLDRTGNLDVPRWGDLSEKLAERIGDLLEELLRGVPSHSHRSLDAATEAGPGDGREQKASLNTPSRKGPASPG